jgi:hypothetical protein
MNTYGGKEVWLHAFFTSTLDRSEWLASRPGLFIPWERAFQYLFYRRLGGPQMVKKKSPTPERKLKRAVLSHVKKHIDWLSLKMKRREGIRN